MSAFFAKMINLSLSFFFLQQIFDYTELSQAQVILPVTSTDDHGATVVALVNNGVIQHHPHVSAASAAQAANGSNPATVVNTVNTNSNGSNSSTTTGGSSTKSRRTWHEYGRNSEVDKVQIPKV